MFTLHDCRANNIVLRTRQET